MKKTFERFVAKYALSMASSNDQSSDSQHSIDQLKKGMELKEDRIPVYVLSYSLPVRVQLDYWKKKVKSVENRPGGLGLGINPVFDAPDSKFKKQAWLGVSEQHKVFESIAFGFSDQKPCIDYEKQRIINEGLKKFGNLEYVHLPAELPKEFYKEAANGVFWPIFHDKFEHAVKEDKSSVYRLMNELMVYKMINKIKSDNNGEVPAGTMVWVHDYHFQSAPKFLKERDSLLKVGYVHHIPFPEITNDFIDKIPLHKSLLHDAIEGILYADSIVFHTKVYGDNFVKSVKNMGLITDENELKKLRDKILINPIGISKEEIAKHFSDGLTNYLYNPLEYVAFADENLGTSVDFEKVTMADIELSQAWTKVAHLSVSSHKAELVNKGAIYDPLKYVPFSEEVLGTTADFDKEFRTTLTRGNLVMDPEKINIGAVSRLDYTKGIQELLDGYYLFLKEKVAEGVTNPGELYQLNIVASAPRDIKAYIDYQKEAIQKMEVILEEFPGSLTFIPGEKFSDLPINNAVQDIIIASSIKDGYLMAAPEALKARVDALNVKGLIKGPNRPSALIISEGAGVVESLKRDVKDKINIPVELSIIACSAESVQEALDTQVSRIAIERRMPEEMQNLNGFTSLIDRINTAESSGAIALDALFHSTPSQLMINDSCNENSSSLQTFSTVDFSALGMLSHTANDSKSKALSKPSSVKARSSKTKGITK